MKLDSGWFRGATARRVTLIGMTGVGKSRLSERLRRQDWFHYSADYRIGTRYLDEPILDNIKREAMGVEFLRDLLRSDSIFIGHNISVRNLGPVTSFLGCIGDPERGGLSLREFRRRQALYRRAQVAAMLDVPEFIRKARDLYGYEHFVNDTAGSLCEVDSRTMIDRLARHTVIVHIRPTPEARRRILEEAASHLWPLCFREEFLDEQLAAYMAERGLPYAALIDPAEFYGWVLPRLCDARLERYDDIARRHGYEVTTDEIDAVRDEADFIELLATAREAAR